MISGDFLDQLSRFNLIVQKRVTSNFVGTRSSVATGQGLTFEDHQQYVPGEDFRRIDWKVYARTEKLFVRRFEEERSLTVHLVCDKSASMKFEDKWDYAAMLSVGFAYLTMKDNEKFQLSLFDDKLHTFKPKKGRQHLAHLIDTLNNIKLSGKSNFLYAMRELKKRVSSRSLLIIVSDFLFDPKEVESGLALFNRSEITCIQVLDKREKELAFKGEFKLIDSEDDSILKTFISPRLQSVYRQKLSEHSAQIKRICDLLHASFHVATTDKQIFEVFFEIMRNR